jgi:hypothetical protein
MSLLRHASEWEEPDRSHTSEPYVPQKSTRASAPCLGRGALACPSCNVPVVVAGPLPIGAALRCPFCRKVGPARSYLRLDCFDTELNDVQVTARLRL